MYIINKLAVYLLFVAQLSVFELHVVFTVNLDINFRAFVHSLVKKLKMKCF
jgi:hypothetical protein